MKIKPTGGYSTPLAGVQVPKTVLVIEGSTSRIPKTVLLERRINELQKVTGVEYPPHLHNHPLPIKRPTRKQLNIRGMMRAARRETCLMPKKVQPDKRGGP